MKRAMMLAVLGVAGLGGSAMGAPALVATRTIVSGFVVYDVTLKNNGTDSAMASYAVSVGFSAVGGTFNQLRSDGTAQTSAGNGVKTYLGAVSANIDGNGTPLALDTYVYDAFPSTVNQQTGEAGTLAFDSAISGVNPFGVGSINGTVWAAGAQTRYAFSYGTPAFNPGGTPPSLGLNDNVPVAHLVLSPGSTNLTFTGIIARQGVNYAVSGGDGPGPEGAIQVIAGGTATTTIAGNNVSYIPTVVQTYATPVTTGSTTFAFAGTNNGLTLIALDLNLGSASLASALGALPANVTVYTGTRSPFSSAYDIVLVASTTGSGPFTLAFNLGAGATANAVAVVPEPAGFVVVGALAVSMLGRRRRA